MHKIACNASFAFNSFVESAKFWAILVEMDLVKGCRVVSREKREIQRITLRKHRCCKLSFMGVLDTLSGLREKWSEQQLNLSPAE